MIQKPKVLILDNSTGITGAYRSVRALTRSLDNSLQFMFGVSRRHLASELSSFHIPFLEIQKSWRVLFYIPMLLVNSLRVNRIINTHKINILHVNDLYNMVGVLLKVIRPGLKVVYHVRLLPNSYASFLYRVWTRLVLRYADAIVCVSQVVFRELPESEKKVIIHDALPVPEFNTEVSKNDKFTFLYPANFIPGKGQEYALAAFRTALPHLGDAQLTFVGGDLDRKKNRNFLNKLKEQVLGINLTGRVIFFDQAQNLDPFYRSAHVVLNFSESESFSMTCLESLLFGTPVIATRCGGPEEIIDDGINGLLVQNKNLEAMKKAMITLFDNEALLKSMASESKRVIEKFSLAKSSNQMDGLYKSLGK